MSSDTLHDLFLAGKGAIKAVMGPDHARALRDLLASDPDSLKELSNAAAKAADDGEPNDFIQRLIDIQGHLLGDKAKAFADQLDQTEREFTAIDGATGAAAERLKLAENKFHTSVEFISNMVERIDKADNKIRKADRQLAASYDSSSSADEDEPVEKTTAQKKKEKAEATRRQEIQDKRNQYITQKKAYQQQIFEHFDDTLGGMHVTIKCRKKELDLPNNLDKATARTIIDA